MSVEAEAELQCCVSHAFFRAASQNPSRIAAIHGVVGGARGRPPGSPSPPPVVCEGDEWFTCGELLSAVDSLSRRIRRVLDVGDDPALRRAIDYDMDVSTESSTIDTNGGASSHRIPNIVGVYSAPSVEYIVAVLSILRCGEAFLPLDPLWPEERILSIVSSSRTSLIVNCSPGPWKDGSRRQDMADWIVDRSNCTILYLSMKVELKEQFGPSDLAWPCKAKSQRSFCYLMYTSGSTGKPKGVCGTEKGLLNRFWWMQERIPLSKDEVLLFKTSISFVDHLQEFLSGILTCTTLIIPPYEELKAYPSHIVHFLKAYCISRMTSVPSSMRAILPALTGQQRIQIRNSLKVLVLSGESFSISLWKALHELLPETTILNLYGSTEVSGDCAYFDCEVLPKILVTESLSSVPIGLPVANCELVLVGEPDRPDEGEIYVAGSCLFLGYFDELSNGHHFKDGGTLRYFKTGDFAKRLQSGEFVFIGRRDRTVKVNGQRIALEEVETTLRDHPEVSDAAVTFHRTQEELTYIHAYVVPKGTDILQEEHVLRLGLHNVIEDLILSIKTWLVRKLPPAMIPSHYNLMELLPVSASGKTDYAMLASSASLGKRLISQLESNSSSGNHMQKIKQVFCDVLLVDEVTDHDDFFVMGGNSISAAHAAHKLGVDMRMLYVFPTPFKLLNAIIKRKDSHESYCGQNLSNGKRLKVLENVVDSSETSADLQNIGSLGGLMQVYPGARIQDPSMELDSNQPNNYLVKNDSSLSACSLKMDSSLPLDSKSATSVDGEVWSSNFDPHIMCSFSRCNQFMSAVTTENNYVHEACLSIEVPTHGRGSLQELWKVLLESCVDASPLVVLRDGKIKLFIGSHSHIFLCIDVLSGSVLWEVMLEDRVECSAAVTGDFLQVVVGCYRGIIYFLDFLSGKISWTFETDGQVKMQPVVDRDRNLIWCGSHDHWLYALDYKLHCCVYKTSCGGSIFGSPSIDKVHDMIYVASTSGRVTAISVKVLPYKVVWQYDSGAPIFGSLTLDSLTGHVICCSVDGHVTALNSRGTIVWKAIIDGPIFAGACISNALPSQVLVCSRNGIVYSFDLESGALFWKYVAGDPITSSAYVDEHTKLISESSHPCYRLACICSSSGSIHVLRIDANARQERIQKAGDPDNYFVQEVAKLNLPGDIFSSPVMIGGRIFVGCRDDYVHCIAFVS